jgi:hypothetical protein
MKMRLTLLTTLTVVVFAVAVVKASEALFDAEACDYQGWHTTGYRVQSTATHDSGVGLGTLNLSEAECNIYQNNTYTMQTHIDVRNTQTWQLLSSQDDTGYRWEGDTSACNITLVINISGERYDGDTFNLNYSIAPSSCDP